MDKDTFKQLVTKRLEDIVTTNEVKSQQYAPGQDRLQHFRDVARLDVRNIEPEEALWDMWKKHIVAIQYLIQDVKAGNSVDPALLDELIRDNVFYPILLEGLLADREYNEEEVVIDKEEEVVIDNEEEVVIDNETLKELDPTYKKLEVSIKDFVERMVKQRGF